MSRLPCLLPLSPGNILFPGDPINTSVTPSVACPGGASKLTGEAAPADQPAGMPAPLPSGPAGQTAPALASCLPFLVRVAPTCAAVDVPASAWPFPAGAGCSCYVSPYSSTDIFYLSLPSSGLDSCSCEVSDKWRRRTLRMLQLCPGSTALCPSRCLVCTHARLPLPLCRLYLKARLVWPRPFMRLRFAAPEAEQTWLAPVAAGQLL